MEKNKSHKPPTINKRANIFLKKVKRITNRKVNKVKIKLEKKKKEGCCLPIANHNKCTITTVHHATIKSLTKRSVFFDIEGKLINERPNNRKNINNPGTNMMSKKMVNWGCSGIYQSMKGNLE